MKAIRNIIVALAILTCAFFTTFAGPYSDAAQKGLPIRSLGVLKAYAEDAVRQGDLGVSYPQTVPGGTVQVHASGDGVGNVVKKLVSKTLSFSFTPGKTKPWIWAQLSDRGGYTLFSAGKETLFKAGVAIHWLEDPSLILGLVPNPPIVVPGIESARIIITNETGGIVADMMIPVNDDRIFYPTNLVERGGDIFLTFREKDGSQSSVVLDARTGAPKETFAAFGSVPLSIEGDYDFGTNPESVSLYGVDLRSAVVHFTVDSQQPAPKSIAVGGQSNTGEVIAYLMRFKGAPTWVLNYLSPNPVNNSLPYYQDGKPFLGDGQYELVYILEPADLDGVPIDNYGGKSL